MITTTALQIPHTDLLEGFHFSSDDLPTYSSLHADLSLPTYTPSDPHAPPTARYTLSKTTRNTQTFTSLSSSLRSYRLLSRTTPRLFSKKADLTLLRNTTLAPHGIPVLMLDFEDSKTLPWIPRAQIYKLSPLRVNPLPAASAPSAKLGRRASTADVDRVEVAGMTSPNFKDWDIAFSGCEPGVFDGCRARWKLVEPIGRRDPELVLSSVDSDSCGVTSLVARFRFSTVGTRAEEGGELGRLDMFDVAEDGGQGERHIEVVMGSLGLVLAHFGRLGRHYSAKRKSGDS